MGLLRRAHLKRRDALMRALAVPELPSVYAFRTADTQVWLDSALLALEQSVDAATGLVLLGPLGQARILNPAAQRLLAAYFRRPCREGSVLPEELVSWLRARGPGRLYIVQRQGGRLRVVLVARGESGALLLTETCQGVLTPRELEVLSQAREGHTNVQIARRLGVSPRTVEKHFERILAKLDVPNRTAAVVKAFGPV